MASRILTLRLYPCPALASLVAGPSSTTVINSGKSTGVTRELTSLVTQSIEYDVVDPTSVLIRTARSLGLTDSDLFRNGHW